MVRVFSEFDQFYGSHYQYGLLQGKKLKQSPILVNRAKQWQTRRKHHFVTQTDRAIDLLKHYLPRMCDEIEGLAEALEWSFDQAVREFAGYYLEIGKSGCSIMTGDDYLVRNYDSHPSGYEGRYLFYYPSDGGYATIGASMQITGRIDGLNERGLAMGYNFTNRIGSGDGFICNMIGRIILESCATVTEAVDLLRDIPHRTSFSYVLIDQTGSSVVVEASPRSVVVRPANMCTNHFELLKEENRFRNDESLERLAQIKQHWHPNLKPQFAYQAFNHWQDGVFSNKYQVWSGTLHTSLYQPNALQAWFSHGANQRPVIFDLAKLLRGERVRVRKITGQLTGQTPFLNDLRWAGPN